MPEDSATLHEPAELLQAKTRDLHRAVVSVVEELQAIDWYVQRVDAAQDPDLRAILQHNAEEEMEHASMLLEWIRRQDAAFAARLRKYLFTEGSIVGREEGDTAVPDARPRPTIGALKPAVGGRR